MKFGPATQFDRRNKAASTKLDNNVILANCDVIVIFLIYDQFGGSRIQMQSEKFTFLLIAICYLTKTENRTKTSLTQISYYCFE